jgi:hypothetical protein
MKATRYVVAFVLLMFLMMPVQAMADCLYNGKRVPEGTRIGPLVCEHGRWVPKP